MTKVKNHSSCKARNSIRLVSMTHDWCFVALLDKAKRLGYQVNGKYCCNKLKRKSQIVLKVKTKKTGR